MVHQSLYRRYRPRRFSELKGQDYVVRVLRNAVREDRVGHAYLFSGPRGTGKTSAARILAKVLNCANPVDGEPCCECASCLAVEAGTSFDVHELDAASNNGVDDIRALVERASLGTAGRRKVYILDEVHMLSRPAEAALLKTLEEPPPHVVFVLATTDPQKVSPTIRGSRTQHLEFHLLPADELEAHVRWVAADAGIPVTDDVVDAVLQMGGGSARDTLSALDQVAAAGGVVPELLPLDELVEALIEGDSGRALAGLAAAVHGGRDPRSLTEELIAHLREAFLAQVAPELVQLPDRRHEIVRDQGRRLGLPATVRAIEVLGEVLVELRHAPDPRVLLDVTLVKLTNPAADSSPAALLARIERLERAATEQATTPPSRPTPPPRPAPPAGGRARLGSAVTESAPERAPREAAEAPPVEPAAPPVEPAPAEDAPAGGPSRDELTLAWADEILPKLSRQAKSVLAAGRWVDTERGVALALPNAPHRDRSEPHRAELTAALARRFGHPVPVVYVLEQELPATRPAVDRPARRLPTPDPEPEEAIDPDELVDAGPEHGMGPIDRLTRAFPGAELVDEG
jgi:DNA polymerase-3 subunit gamma/tau